MVPRKHPNRELSRRSLTPWRHVFLGRNPILIANKRINWARHRRLWRTAIACNGAGRPQRGQHPDTKFFVLKKIRIHAGHAGDQVQHVVIGKILDLLVPDMTRSRTSRDEQGDETIPRRLESQRHFESQHSAHTVTKKSDWIARRSRRLHHCEDFISQGGNTSERRQAIPVALPRVLDSDPLYVR